jgi:hypothetical protein
MLDVRPAGFADLSRIETVARFDEFAFVGTERFTRID